MNENLKRVFLTENDIFTYAASGTGAFEGAVQNLFSPGDKVLVVNNGNFGGRWVKMCRAFGLEVTELAYDWGQKADNDDVVEALAGDPEIKAAICVLSETSTGTVNDIEGFARATQCVENVVSIVDAVSGLGACTLRTDEWGVDVVVAGSQKALMTPPGLGFVSVSQRAMRMHAESRMPRYYFDWTAAKKAYEKDPPQTAALISGSLASASATSSLSAFWPHAYLSSVTSRPKARPIFTQRPPKLPLLATRILSPGEKRFWMAPSKAPVPLAA